MELFEKNADLLMAASQTNQYRLHRGYHYPRSIETAVSCRDDESSFRSEYAEAVLDRFEHFFAISRDNSLTSASQYLDFLELIDLEYRLTTPSFLKNETLDVCIRAKESLFDHNILRKLVWHKLNNNDVVIHLGREALPSDLEDFDFIVIATYAALNDFLPQDKQQSYQFEVCEKLVLNLPHQLSGKSVVIMDGGFMCINPMGTSGLSVMGHVVHAIHHRNVGLAPEIPEHLKPYLNSGIVLDPQVTKAGLFLESAKTYFQGIEDVKHVGSMFVVRTVLPGADDTDARPTVVKKVSDRIVTVFSGKIGTCVHAADEVVSLIERS